MSRPEHPLVLVVEDEFLISLDLERILQELGYRILGPAASVAQALALLHGSEPDAALLDVSLKAEDVFPVADALDGRGVPFAFTSGYDQADRMPPRFRHCRTLPKPFGTDDIAELIAALLPG